MYYIETIRKIQAGFVPRSLHLALLTTVRHKLTAINMRQLPAGPYNTVADH